MIKKRVGLIYGGKSSEHEVSLRSAHSIIKSIDYSIYEVTPFMINIDGSWSKGEKIKEPFEEFSKMKLSNSNKFNPFELKNEIDVFFPVVHGPYGEDGSLQGFLEIIDVPYVGCGVLSSSTGMDKIAMKKMFSTAGLNQCKYLYFDRKEIFNNLDNVSSKISNELKFPCFIKPANLGSSVGITKANNIIELKDSLMFASKFDKRIIVEENIIGREVEIGILGNELPLTSSIGEVVSNTGFYDYSAKYKDGNTIIKIPTELPVEIVQKIENEAKKAYEVLDCSGLSRIDFFYLEDENEIMINEINTMPGFTNFSMYPSLFKEVGIEYSELIDRLLMLAVDRFEDRKTNLIVAEDFEKNKEKIKKD